ncbi:MAG: alpha/beta hydrolase family protein [Candidatus Hodarchaeota archaeon]
MENLIVEDIDIPVKSDNLYLKGSIYFTPQTPSKAPFLINLAGLLDHRESYFVKYYTEKFASAGYYVLSYDYRAHGKTKKQTGSRWDRMIIKIFEDIHIVIDWIIENQFERLLDNKIALFGRSLGGAIILSHGFLEERVRILIALCTRYDYHTTKVAFPEEIIKKISPKYFLRNDPLNNDRILIAHCKDDDRIPFENLNHIKEALNLKEENAIIFQSGGHSFKGHRDDIFLHALEFLKKL